MGMDYDYPKIYYLQFTTVFSIILPALIFEKSELLESGILDLRR